MLALNHFLVDVDRHSLIIRTFFLYFIPIIPPPYPYVSGPNGACFFYLCYNQAMFSVFQLFASKYKPC